MTVSGLVLLMALALFLIERFDVVAAQREQVLVDLGFVRQIDELAAVVATQVDWDDAIINLDHKFDAEWADFNVGNYLYTFNGFSHSFVLDRNNTPIYAAIRGERVTPRAFADFASITAPLLQKFVRQNRAVGRFVSVRARTTLSFRPYRPAPQRSWPVSAKL